MKTHLGDRALARLSPPEREELFDLIRRRAERPGGLEELIDEMRTELRVALRHRGLSPDWISPLLASVAKVAADTLQEGRLRRATGDKKFQAMLARLLKDAR